MKRIGLMALAVAGLVSLGLLAGPSGAAAQAKDLLPQQTMMDCARMPDSSARLSCYDRVIMLQCEKIKDKDARLACFDRVMRPRAAGAPAPARAPVASAPPAAPRTTAAPSQAQVSAPPPVQAAAPAAPRAQPAQAAPPAPPTAAQRKAAFGLPEDKQPQNIARNDEPDEVQITVASVGQLAAGKVSLTSTDGAVWDQTTGAPPNRQPKPGDVVTIRRNFLGGYRCQLNKWEDVRCRRVQ